MAMAEAAAVTAPTPLATTGGRGSAERGLTPGSAGRLCSTASEDGRAMERREMTRWADRRGLKRLPVWLPTRARPPSGERGAGDGEGERERGNGEGGG